jgi:hypothetical protein
MEEKFLIGIGCSGMEQVIGSISLVLVAVDTNFFRRFSWLPIKDNESLTPVQVNKVVDCTRKHLKDFAAIYITPNQIKKDELDDMECRGIIDLLNKVYQFWKHKIHIQNFDISREGFIERFHRLLPENFKAYSVMKGQDIELDKWVIEPDCNLKHKISTLAAIYARYYSLMNSIDIQSVWGEYGVGNLEDPKTLQFINDHPTCPHIRKELVEPEGGKNGENKT